MLGYRGGTSQDPFLRPGVSVLAAKAHATEHDLERFLLLPNRHPYQHRAYIRRAPGKYERMHTRLFVFSHLLTTGNAWIPTPEEVRTGEKLQDV